MSAPRATITARFHVLRTTETRRASYTTFVYFLEHYAPEPPSEEDAVDDLLWEVADAAIPKDFGFVQTALEQRGVQGHEGIEVIQEGEERMFDVGDIVDVEIRAVGRSERAR